VILLGPPGVGKGTQGVQLGDGFGLRHFSTGDVLRRHRKESTELGRKAQSFMDRGELVPDELILDMVRDEVGGLNGEGIVFDGFPRTEVQAKALGPVLAEGGRKVDAVVVLDAQDEVIVQRLAGRRSCPSCGSVFNVYTNPPKVEGRCDRCGAELVHRVDDQPETIRRRLQVYRDETEPLIRFYEKSGADMIPVNGDQPVDHVQAEIRRSLAGGGAA
jgi:adenylate kinase